MSRFLVANAISVARGLASEYLRRLNGAGPFGWWHLPHRLKRIGAMSFENVTGGRGAASAASVKRAMFATVAQAAIAKAIAHDLIGKTSYYKDVTKGKLGT
jgi:hypothetical protein